MPDFRLSRGAPGIVLWPAAAQTLARWPAPGDESIPPFAARAGRRGTVPFGLAGGAACFGAASRRASARRNHCLLWFCLDGASGAFLGVAFGATCLVAGTVRFWAAQQQVSERGGRGNWFCFKRPAAAKRHA